MWARRYLPTASCGHMQSKCGDWSDVKCNLYFELSICDWIPKNSC